MVVAPKRVKRIHPKKFALWTSLLSMIMLFSALTSAYIVRKGGANWYDFPIPDMFFYSTGVILSASVFLHISYKSFVNKNYGLYQVFLSLGFIFGILFVALQYMGWLVLNNEYDIFVNTNPSSSFFVLIVGTHALHVIGGLTALLISWIYAIKPSTRAWSPKGQLRLELTFTFWHFVDALWLYLLAFLWFQQ